MRLPLETEARYVTLDDAPTVEDSYKEYLCPECQPVFYLSDLQQIHSGREIPGFALGDAGYVDHVWRALSRTLGSLLNDLVRKQTKKTNLFTGDEEFRVTAWVLRPEAIWKMRK